jgi:flagellar assembly factor FliW
MNLRAPILINLDRRLGCQVVTTDDQPLQMELTKPTAQLRKSA